MVDKNPYDIDTASHLITSVNRGELMAELNNAAHEVLAVATKYAGGGKRSKGSVSLKIDLMVGEDGTVEVRTGVNKTMPKPPPLPKAVYWLRPGGFLTAANPAQHDMFPQPVVIDGTPAKG